MVAKPIVDGIEEDFRGVLTVIRINVQDAGSGPILAQYGFQFTPTFIFFDRNGEELWRTVGVVDPIQVSKTLDSLS